MTAKYVYLSWFFPTIYKDECSHYHLWLVSSHYLNRNPAAVSL
jgi:hypothetical protein